MFRWIPVALALSLPANAQFSGMATPADGSRVYFATGLRQKNTSQPLWGKLFVIDSTGLRLFLSRDERVFSGTLSNPYNLTGATISSDGKVFAASATRDCVGPGEVCTRAEIRATTISAGGQDKDYPGDLRLSAGGTWAFGMGTSPPTPLFTAYLANVATGETIIFSHNVFQIASAGRPVADDGTVVYSDFNSIVVQHGSDTRHITALVTGVPVKDAVIDASGTTVVFTAGTALYLADATGSGSSLLAANGFAPTLSDDGKMLLYLSNRNGSTQIRIAKLGGGPTLDRQLGFVVGGISTAILSGDGSSVCAVAADGRMLKIAVATGIAQELIPRTPYFTMTSQFAPGKLVTVTGGGFSDLSFIADPPLPETLNGVSATVQEKKARMLSVAPDAILMIVPPDVTPVEPFATVPVAFTISSPSPFETPPLNVTVAASAPEFVSRSDSALAALGVGSLLVAAHQDWSALVTPDNPARPGEAIHAYGLGFGPTSPAVPFGSAAPAREPFARITSPFSCDGVQVLYQGLAPNFAGVYQFDFLVPGNAARGVFILRCVQGGAGGPVIFGNVPVA